MKHSVNEGRSIIELIAFVKEHEDTAIVAKPAREILNRSGECKSYVPELLELLGHSSPAIADLMFVTLKRIGKPVIESLLERLEAAQGDYRSHLLSLLSFIADLSVSFPVLKRELESSDVDMRFWAANCLGRLYRPGDDWSAEQMKALEQAVELLRTARDGERRDAYWLQARMTLRHLGVLRG